MRENNRRSNQIGTSKRIKVPGVDLRLQKENFSQGRGRSHVTIRGEG